MSCNGLSVYDKIILIRSIFPSYYDDGWTQEQSDKAHFYYPVILNGVVVSGLTVYEDLDSHEMGWQGPQLVNPLNALIQQIY